MTAFNTFAEGALTLEQWQHVEALARTLTPAQARWISGYFAGLDAGLLRAGAPAAEAAAPPAAQGRTLTILYGTETGNSRDLAKALAAAAAERGLSPQIADMSDYKTRLLKDEQDLLVIVSTYGEGDPPQPSVGFFEFLEGKRAPKLDKVRFSVLALGDSTYERYCEAGKRVDARLEELGATRIGDRVDCDIDYDEPAAAWSQAVIDRLAADLVQSATALPGIAVPSAIPTGSGTPVFDKKNPFAATVIENIAIVGRHSSKETRHIEVDLAGSGLSYEPGDAIGIAAVNDAVVVEQLLAATGLAAEAPVTVKGETVPLGEALARKYEVAVASPRFLDQWAKLTGAAELEALRGEERAADRLLYLRNNHVVDIVRKFPLPGVDADSLLAGLRPLQPRLYSIASSLAAAPDEAHLTVAPVRYTLHGAPRSGVASSQLADRIEIGDTLPVYIQHNPHFGLPKTAAPIIMIGAGTGVAPYRGFLQEWEATGTEGRSWLFFGERNFRSDFLYQTEWQQWLKEGVLTRMDVAFSRDPGQPKTYVQHRMLEQARDLYAWLEEGAHVYVCGDEKSMARDVHDTLIQIVSEQGRVDRDTAEDYVRRLASDHRYQRDVY
ncbi:assimilatory sulfite reductase (NADPH) flavoprotein subunit [Sphingosinicella sp. BN140058]|uniref:assimilatory sulfite reductase (NADPH) flavoprotein subunit n=1 Tax=Sphingosinicella sp. BN140058 TaxID=1892855 RepID=UPI0010125A90|nr:assimilatory sulfite reductase (NADPH) flavoprotein subunit [Sphingosinicella sp. BN140058]QAY77269.1 assimilatory sulfite reductase (NADPH) flavoprotein subunit [Sphingosinicella sp. BN140058]